MRKNNNVTLAFALIGSFAFANNSTINEKQLKLSEKNLDLKFLTKLIIPFMQMVSSGTLNIIKFVKLDKSFLFIDDCGNGGLLNMTCIIHFLQLLTASEIIYEVTGINNK
jgi:hypothetical protein